MRYPDLLFRMALGIHHGFSDTALGAVQRVPGTSDRAPGQGMAKVTKRLPLAAGTGERWTNAGALAVYLPGLRGFLEWLGGLEGRRAAVQ